MDSLRFAHVFALGLWGGLVLAESVIEIALRRPEGAKHAARLHWLIDVLFEFPLLLAIVGTGTALLVRAWPPSPLLAVKVACAAIALGANAWCGVLVVRRRNADGEELLALARRVRATGVGVPFGAAALVIGLVWMHR